MTSTAETIAQTRYDCLRVSHLEGARLWSDLSEGSQDLFIDREKTFIFALNEAGLRIFTKQQAIDYVLDLPIEDFANTPLPEDAVTGAGKRLKAMIEGANNA